MSRLKSRLSESRLKSRLQPRHGSRFDVVVSDYRTSVREWQHAQRAAKSELPALTSEEKRFAQKLGLDEEGYARTVLATKFSAENMHERALALGELVQSILEKIASKWKVQAVVAEMFKERWIVKMQSVSGSAGIAVPREVADDILDSGLTSEVKKLKAIVLDALREAETQE